MPSGIDGVIVARRLASEMPPAPLVPTFSRPTSDYDRRMADSSELVFLPQHEPSGTAVAATAGGA